MFNKKLSKLKEVILLTIDSSKTHYYNKQIVNTQQRALEIIDKISELNPVKNKIKIQNYLADIDGILSMESTDAKRKEFQVLYDVFESINPAWISFDKILMKIVNNKKITSIEWLNTAKEMLNSMLNKDLDISLGSTCLWGLMFLMGKNIQVDDKIEDLFMRYIDDISTLKEVKNALKQTNELIQRK